MHVDQTWTPSTRDLQVELPALMRRLEDTGFAVFRVTYNFADWDETSRRAEIGGRIVKLGGFNTMERGLIIVTDGSGRNRVRVRTPSST
jgi:hypothetical protein